MHVKYDKVKGLSFSMDGCIFPFFRIVGNVYEKTKYKAKMSLRLYVSVMIREWQD